MSTSNNLGFAYPSRITQNDCCVFFEIDIPTAGSLIFVDDQIVAIWVDNDPKSLMFLPSNHSERIR